MRAWINLVESLLFEALTRGSQGVMNNKDMVKKLADAIREDIMFNPNSFPYDIKVRSKRLKDQELAQWFMDQLDNIERTGYLGHVYSRDGVNSQWIVSKYILGSHNWEDISGSLSMNLSKWYYLKNQDLLDPLHVDIQKFKGIRELGMYIVTHYSAILREYEQEVQRKALEKKFKVTARSVKLIDNDDYTIYISLNRPANCLIGAGTTWCTTAAEYSGHFHNYSNQGMLFQMFPKDPKHEEIPKAGRVITGRERYQFGPDRAFSFMDIADNPPNPRYITDKFPYLWYDLKKALTNGKTQLEEYMKSLSEDETLNSDPDTKVKVYKIDDELKKLTKFLDKGYFTNKVRPEAPPEEVPAD